MIKNQDFQRAISEGATPATTGLVLDGSAACGMDSNLPHLMKAIGRYPGAKKKPLTEKPANIWVFLSEALHALPLSYPTRT